MTLPLNHTINTIAVIGAGTMGIGIAQVAATAGLSVLLFDVNQDVLSRSLSTMTQRLRKRVEQGKAKLEVTEAIITKIAVVKSLSALSDAQLVIEAVAEKLEIKQAIF
ncbi:Probable 3-hydroxybutyryl-CoA dehydrogenase [Providencia rettgeri]|uniref:Probable 3-hydroxybutyryl-CoA dehydrogenase n=2 Tax=Providencia rettgeri TaxID=587 RepID=A0A379FKU2_PRORE|nr:Probable 3-hydroxybutyryl-CoA dehydrogenase [Providencia rettgeri]